MPIDRVYTGRTLRVSTLHSSAGVATQLLAEDLDGGSLLLDCGDGTLRDLLEAGIDPADLDGVLLSHGHFDHLGGLHSLLGFLRMVGRGDPLTVTYPEGCLEAEGIIGTFRSLYPNLPFVIEDTPLEDGDILELAPWGVEAFAVNHAGSTAAGVGEPIPALAYRVELGEETLAFSGDSGPCEALGDVCAEADIALVEATWDDDPPFAEGERVHLTRSEAEGYGRLAKDYRLIHRRHESRPSG